MHFVTPCAKTQKFTGKRWFRWAKMALVLFKTSDAADVYDYFARKAQGLPCFYSVTTTIAPPFLAFSARIEMPSASASDFAIERPSPAPPAFLVCARSPL